MAKTRRWILGTLATSFWLTWGVTFAAAEPASQADSALAALVHGQQRSEANIKRDPFRHPIEVLNFFGVKADATVVEILPGSGAYWTEILAPYLKDHGRYIAANFESSDRPEIVRDEAAFATKLAHNPDLYGKVIVTEFAADRHEIAPAESADFVLTFRNIHNWMNAGEAEASFRAFYKALKPGGILGVEEHRASPDQVQDPLAKDGYVRQDFAIALAEKAGFKFIGSSEINANPKDTKNYPAGVWTLPPTYRLKDQDKEKYTAIGESDRFILKFVKPVTSN
jgi:predicted methyltransferase